MLTKGKYITNWAQVKLLLTLSEVAFILDVSNEQARRLCARGDIPATKVGNEWRVEKTKLQAYLGVSG